MAIFSIGEECTFLISIIQCAASRFGFTLQSEQQGEVNNLPDVWDFEDQDSQAYGQVRLLDARQVFM